MWTLLVLLAHAAAAADVVVEAGESNRVDTPVSVRLDWSVPEKNQAVLCESDGKRIPAQLEPDPAGGVRAWWIVDRLPKGSSRKYRLSLGPQESTEEVFSWSESDGRTMDLSFAGRPVLRYVHEEFDPADPDGIRKPYHHVFDPDGSRIITKGTGGKYTHHRGIFFGYSKTIGDGQSSDTWHCVQRGAYQRHVEVLRSTSGPVFGGHVVAIEWKNKDGKSIAREVRSLRAFRQSGPHALIEFQTEVRPTGKPLRLFGDRQHAGVQFRAAQEVADREKETRYLRPAAWAGLPPDKEINDARHVDLPWNAMQFRVGDRPYTVAYLSDPANPEKAEMSERLYGRFGEFIPHELTADKPLELRYRFWVTAGEAPTREAIEGRYADLAQPPVVQPAS